MGLVKRAVPLQKRVLKEQGVAGFEDLVLRYADSVGKETDPGSIAEDTSYGHLLAVNPQKKDKPIGMRAMERASIAELGEVVIDYYPALVPLAEQGKRYEVDMPLFRRSGSGMKDMNLVQILIGYDKNVPSGVNVAARITDGVGIPVQFLRDADYLKCEIEVGVPSPQNPSFLSIVSREKDGTFASAMRHMPGPEPALKIVAEVQGREAVMLNLTGYDKALPDESKEYSLHLNLN